MRFTCRHLLLFLFLGWLNIAQALEQEGGFWTQINTDGKITADERWTYFTDIQFRYHASNFHLDSTLPEAGIGYHFTKSSSAWIGYQLQLNSTPFNKSNNHHYFQQFLWHTSFPPIVNQFSIRSRLEERTNTVTAGTNLRWRERFTFLFRELSKFPQLEPVVYDEIFINLRKTDWAYPATIPQNRLFIGLHFPITPQATMDLGYLNQYLAAQHHNEALINHILFVGLNL
jgi:hypothetical protein